MWEQYLGLCVYHLSIYSYIQSFIHSTSIIECLLYARDCRNTKGSKRFPLILGRDHFLGIILKCNVWKVPYLGVGEGNGNPLQYSCLENPIDGGAWWAAVHGVTGSQTWLSDFTFTFHFHALEKEMATHFSVLAWRIPGMAEPGGLPSMGSRRVGHYWSDLAAAAAGC